MSHITKTEVTEVKLLITEKDIQHSLGRDKSYQNVL